MHGLLALLAACEPGDPPDSGAADRCGPVLQADYDCEDVEALPALERTVPSGIPVTDVVVSLAVGDLAGTGTPQVYVGTNTTLTRLDGEGWATATHLWVHASGRVVPLLADLTADGVTDLVLGLPQSDDGAGQVLLFPGPVTGPLDWDSPHVELQGEHGEGDVLHAADLDGDGILDLVVDSSVVFGPVEEGDALGSGADATFDMVPEAVADLTGDGLADLLFLGSRPDEECDTLDRGQPLILPGPLSAGAHSAWDGALQPGVPADLMVFAISWQRVADADGDGLLDLLVAAFDTTYTTTVPVLLAVWPGPLVGGDAPAHRLAFLAHVMGDIDGDGIDDGLGEDPVTDADGLLVRLGPLVDGDGIDPESCTLAVDERWLGIEGTEGHGAWTGDLDGDGLPDVVLPGTTAEGQEVVYVVLGAAR